MRPSALVLLAQPQPGLCGLVDCNDLSSCQACIIVGNDAFDEATLHRAIDDNMCNMNALRTQFAAHALGKRAKGVFGSCKS